MVRVIIADDDKDMVSSTSEILEQKGIKVVGKAYDGEEAARLYSIHKPDVLLLDLMMPNYDGHYAIEKIKQEDPEAKIIVISAYLDKFFESNKVIAIFSKPCDFEDIANRIKEISKK